jgi:hypothetical protein
MRTDMIALCAIFSFLQFLGFLHQDFHARAPIKLAGLLSPLPWRAAEVAGEQAREASERVVRPCG